MNELTGLPMNANGSGEEALVSSLNPSKILIFNVYKFLNHQFLDIKVFIFVITQGLLLFGDCLCSYL